jgi:hypothetical protein
MSHKKQQSNIIQRDVVLWINILLLGMASLLLFYYVMMSNSIAAKNYKIQTLRTKLSSLSEINSSLMSKKISLESPTTLIEFARAQSLVEAKDIVYIFEKKNVAQK